MRKLKNLLYTILFVSNLIFNYGFTAVKEGSSQTIGIKFVARFTGTTCDGLDLDDQNRLVDFGLFTVDELRQGTVSAQKLHIRLRCNIAGDDPIDKVLLMVRAGPHGYLDNSTLLTSNGSIGIKLISSKHGITISDSNAPLDKGFELSDEIYEEELVFKPVYIEGKEISLGKFETSAIIEIRYI